MLIPTKCPATRNTNSSTPQNPKVSLQTLSLVLFRLSSTSLRQQPWSTSTPQNRSQSHQKLDTAEPEPVSSKTRHLRTRTSLIKNSTPQNRNESHQKLDTAEPELVSPTLSCELTLSSTSLPSATASGGALHSASLSGYNHRHRRAVDSPRIHSISSTPQLGTCNGCVTPLCVCVCVWCVCVCVCVYIYIHTYIYLGVSYIHIHSM
jgi:hypothetical protein